MARGLAAGVGCRGHQLPVTRVGIAIDHPNGHRRYLSAIEMPRHGMVHKAWLQMSKPTVMDFDKDKIVFIPSIEPYTPKRSRE